MIDRSALRYDALLVGIMSVWGLNYPMTKLALLGLDTLTVVLLRNATTLAILAIVLWLAEGDLRFRRPHLGRLIVAGAIGIAANQLAYNLALRYTSVANGSLLITMSPVFGLLIGRLFLQERPTGKRWLGVIASFLGVALIIIGGHNELTFGISTIFGDLMVLVAAFTWALYAILTRPLLKLYSPLRLTFCCSAIGVPLLLPLGLPPTMAMPWPAVPALSLTMALTLGLGSAATNILWYRTIDKVGSTRSLVFMYLIPVFAVISGMIILGEGITVLQLVGAVVVLGGVNTARSG